MNEVLTQRQIVALSPTELIPAQASLVEWCRQKTIALSRELREQRENLRQAKTMKWKHSGWLAAVKRTKERMVYYTKIRSAFQAGYLMIPNFDVDVVAVRVQSSAPKDETDISDATAELLPPNTGRYVDNRLVGYSEEREYKNSAGEKRTTTDFHPTDFNETIDFPVRLVKPSVLAATDRAMALRLFDRIGVVQGTRKSDPIVVGQIIDPLTPTSYGQRRNNPRCVSFFVAWWLNTETL